jgi:N-acetylglucosamine-6-phosphate deacetylase
MSRRPAPPTVLSGRVVLADRMVPDGVVVLDGDRITGAGTRDAAAVPEGAVTADLPADVLLLPGLVDVHCHGGGGGEFGADADSARRAVAHHHRSGTTSVVASLVSASREALVAGMQVCARLAADGLVAGVHSEGPFLSPARCGAQDPDALIGVDLDLVDELAVAGAGHWRVMTFAPELDGAAELIARLASQGIVPSVGHTDASARVTAQALSHARAAGRRPPLVTHLFNAMPPLHHRDPGPIAAMLAAAARGEAVLELVGDGVHLADETVAMVMDVAAPGCVVLVTDAMAASGMPEGRYTLGRLDVVVADGTVRLAEGGAIAGGVATLLDVVRRCVHHAGVPLVDAVAAASSHPASALGLDGEVGALAAGLRADVLAVDGSLRPVAVWRGGARLTSVA